MCIRDRNIPRAGQAQEPGFRRQIVNRVSDIIKGLTLKQRRQAIRCQPAGDPAVSYTHLDVYKRQALPAPHIGHDAIGAEIIAAVSDIHQSPEGIGPQGGQAFHNFSGFLSIALETQSSLDSPQHGGKSVQPVLSPIPI